MIGIGIGIAIGPGDGIGIAVVGWCAAALGFTIVTLVAVARLRREIRLQRTPARWPSIWILRPCEGDEPHLEANLASSLARYDGARRVLILVPSAGDPSRAVAERVAAGRDDVEVLITDVAGAKNRKSAQLTKGLARASSAPSPPEVIVQVDSDVLLDDASLPSLLMALGDDPRVAAAFAPPVELEVASAGDLAASGLLSASHQSFFALAALSSLTGGVHALAGALAAHRRAELEAAGGFAPLEELLGEDFEMSRRLHAVGKRVAVADAPARTVDAGRPFSQVLARTTRWATVVKRQRGALILTYPLLLAPTPLLLLASTALALAGHLAPLACAAALLAARALLALRLRAIHRAPVGVARALALAMAAEVLMLLASARALTTSHVVWRGRRLRILRGGVIE